MKIIFNRQAIMAAVNPLMSTVSGKSVMSSIEGILIEARVPDICILTTFDLEKGTRIETEAKVIEEGSYIINAQKFNQTLRVMTGDEICLEVDKKLCATISCGKSSHKMNALESTDFPAVPNLKSNFGFVIEQAVLKNMIGSITYAMGVNDQRPILNGCYFKVQNNRLMLVSCDSFKLAKYIKEVKIENKNTDQSDLSFSFIVPVKTVNELYRLLSDDESTVRIYMTRKNIIFEINGLTFFSRLVDGEYIDYERIIVKNQKIQIDVLKSEFLEALQRAALITEERIAGNVRAHVKLELCENLLKILATSAAGSTYDEISVDYDGAPMSISFNNKYLMDSISACNCDKIKFSMSSPLTSVNIEPSISEKGTDEIYMLLPVRTKD